MNTNLLLYPLQEEQIIISTFLAEGHEALAIAHGAGLQPAEFSRADLAAIYRFAIEMMIDRKIIFEPGDTLFLFGELAYTQQRIEAFGGSGALTELSHTHRASLLGLEERVLRVRDAARRRQIIQEARSLIDAAQNTGTDIGQAVSTSTERILRVSSSQKSVIKTGKDLAAEAYQRQEARQLAAAEGGDPLGLSTGFPSLDEALRRDLLPSWLVLFAARPGMGKTSLVLNIIRRQLQRGVGVGVFSLEMPDRELADKMIAIDSQVPTSALARGDVSDPRYNWGRITDSIGELAEWPIQVIDLPSLHIQEISNYARLMKARDPNLGVLVIDYIQLAEGDGNTEEKQLSDISKRLKTLGKELGVLIIALAQLNRGCESRSDKRPMASDLRGSGQLEQDADLIVMLYRHILYDPGALGDANKIELLVRKFRHGPTGEVVMGWDGETQTITDRSAPSRLPPGPRGPRLVDHTHEEWT